MKQTMKKIGALIMAFAMMVSMVSFPVQAEAAETKVIYMKPGVWASDSAWFAAWYWGNDITSAWGRLEFANEEGLYKVSVPIGCTGIKFLRKIQRVKT